MNRLVGFVVSLSICRSALADGAYFKHLGFIPHGKNLAETWGNAVSADGTAVVGRAVVYGAPLDAYTAFRWSAADGMVNLGDLPGGRTEGWALAVSNDGSVVVGTGADSNWDEDDGTPIHKAWRWTAATGIVGLGSPPGVSFVRSSATGVSPDGSIIVGYGDGVGGGRAFRWTQATGMVALNAVSNDEHGGSAALAISTDGSTIAGSLGDNAMRWTQATGMVRLANLPGGVEHGYAMALSSDGHVAVGICSSAAAGIIYEACRWDEAGNVFGLGNFPSHQFYSAAYGVSGDGSIIVGTGLSDDGLDAFIWDANHGMRHLRDVLVDEYGLGESLEGWTLPWATAISSDGMTIVGIGSGQVSDNWTEAWIVHLPEPSSILLLGIGLIALLVVKKQSARLPERITPPAA